MNGKDLFLLKSDENAGFIECASAIGDTSTLLQFIFYCIIDTSEVPEFAFGVHISSSQASTKEQSPILCRRIDRKREQVESSWQMFARMALAMLSATSGSRFTSFAADVVWDAVMDKDEQADAQTLYSVTQALTMAKGSNILSSESAVNYLARYIDTMSEWEGSDGQPGEKDKIADSRMLDQPIEEAYPQSRQIDEINKALGEGDEE